MANDNSKGCGPRWGWARKGPWWAGKGQRRGFGGPPWMGMGRPGRMFGQGDLRLLLLALIADKPSHGYDLIRTIEERFGGAYSPSPGTIYPTLTLLEEQELISGRAEAGGKKSYAATQKGVDYLAANRSLVEELMARVEVMAGASSRDVPESLMHAIMTLRHAIMARQADWTEAELSRVRAILEVAARDIIAGEKKD